MKLADGKMIFVRGLVNLEIIFGTFKYFGTFFVLTENVPLILGMTFFTDVAPAIDWQCKTVCVRG